ncbi:DNA polymerase [Acidovorax sp. 99]|uniref:TIGR03915 family putative DNA repair protein n=1 Tax=Acidovorax sp. 99 TaxID=2135634 RepID=UPI000D5E0230|nr:TIGR03915 family putative DNA repair protein [Acidovorax sp. 99]PVY90826.1 DNA polymerase [Acidovorax sp. 99]
MQRHTITLDHATDWPGFRQAARALVQANVPPQTVDWRCQADAAEDLFAPEPAASDTWPSPASDAPPLRVPPDFVHLCEQLILHRDPGRFALMYRLLWRMAQGGHEADSARHDPLDADRMLAHHMVRSVRRDIHKMHAFLRFRPVVEPDGQTLHMAWFEPDHYITVANAGFFIRRFTQMRWAILTPDASVRWDGQQLHTGPGAQRSDAPPPDAGEALWLTYYRHIFNPARLKLAMMKKEMPTRYWHNLPEAALITELAQTAHERSAKMVEAEATVPRRRIAGTTAPRARPAGGAPLSPALPRASPGTEGPTPAVSSATAAPAAATGRAAP